MTPSSTIKISSDRIIKWMSAVRNSSGQQQTRLLESFWESQITSKAWLINTIKMLDLPIKGDVYVFGGWYGILASLIKDEFSYQNVYTIDKDPSCKYVGEGIDDRIHFITGDMKDFQFKNENIGLVINTSTEHIHQEIFNSWLKNVPNEIPIVLQGNDFFSCKEHVRCSNSLENFMLNNRLDKVVFKGALNCKQFTRFMIIGYKNAN